MADDVYQNALRRREDLKRELQRIEQFLALYEEFKVVGAADLVAPAARVEARGRVSRPRNPSKEAVAAKARELILKAQKPMTRGELVEALEEAGMTIHGADPSKVIGTMLWRVEGKFTNIEGLGYWPADVELPAHIRKEIHGLLDD